MIARILSLIGLATVMAFVVLGFPALALSSSMLATQPSSRSQAAATTVAATQAPTTQPIVVAPIGLWRCEYFSNRDFYGTPSHVGIQANPNFNVRNAPVFAGMPKDNFAIRCTSNQRVPALDNYVFQIKSDGAVRLTVDGNVVTNEWYASVHNIRANVALREGVHALVLEYYDDIGRSNLVLDWLPGCDAWTGRFYNNPHFQPPLQMIRCDGEKDGALNIDVGDGVLAQGLGTDNVSATWEQNVYFKGGNYRFTTDADDVVQILIDRRPVFANNGIIGISSFEHSFRPGRHHVQILLVENSDNARIRLNWERIQ